MRVNLNQQVSVKLTPKGIELYSARYTNLHFLPSPLQNNTWSGPLWDAMHLFGPGMVMGGNPPIETNIVIAPNDTDPVSMALEEVEKKLRDGYSVMLDKKYANPAVFKGLDLASTEGDMMVGVMQGTMQPVYVKGSHKVQAELDAALAKINMLEAEKKDIEVRHQQYVEHQQNQIGELGARLEVREKFKSYVHNRLDQEGVAEDPGPLQVPEVHCRIHRRLDWLFAKIELLEEVNKNLKHKNDNQARTITETMEQVIRAKAEALEARKSSDSWQGNSNSFERSWISVKQENDRLKTEIDTLRNEMEYLKVPAPVGKFYTETVQDNSTGETKYRICINDNGSMEPAATAKDKETADLIRMALNGTDSILTKYRGEKSLREKVQKEATALQTRIDSLMLEVAHLRRVEKEADQVISNYVSQCQKVANDLSIRVSLGSSWSVVIPTLVNIVKERQQTIDHVNKQNLALTEMVAKQRAQIKEQTDICQGWYRRFNDEHSTVCKIGDMIEGVARDARDHEAVFRNFTKMHQEYVALKDQFLTKSVGDFMQTYFQLVVKDLSKDKIQSLEEVFRSMAGNAHKSQAVKPCEAVTGNAWDGPPSLWIEEDNLGFWLHAAVSGRKNIIKLPNDGSEAMTQVYRKLVNIKHEPQAFDIDFWRDSLARLCADVHQANKNWWIDLSTGQPKNRNVGELLMLATSELAEAMEGHRKNLKDDKLPERPMLEVELADAVIRIFDMAHGLKLDLPGAFVDKMIYNSQRADHKIEQRKKDGGKKY